MMGVQDGPDRPRRVALVEDEPNIREALRFILSRAGWRPFVIGDGATAAERLAEDPPDAAILDVMLPGRSGFDVLRALRADPATAALPVLMLTARGQDKDRALALALGADDFMTKPFSNAEVVERLDTLARAPQAN
ncbi:response regulator receiver domain-containing protein [Hasllibacter halocynthiae]|uniref:Response regulator receiver domain-containing protein n=1 Tax=Hasllibacter halocynthiae TaxID=595589 RepID=A0A2T0X7L3_9RHOB|nr:response regulator [Hasllibacter halocynthiae]PRY94864.1 response regulator receiver domain-containing protein [Hasllibacter halocynthiae]